ncbi:rhomboid family intramembrane serine protease [uncultured Desulfosarcina sp.]|uniref:rhomboid family intramembrane serine protease n=1 Tax=uncultured Desulfosarcina sp. TaxID=218289 RepID=UPI0029C73F8A|nr:rhomboid family intramembrane serine protease [uncultured Desulfosarcina sp.]
MTPLFHNLDREEAHIYSLVLKSADIGNRVVAAGGGYRIDVPEPFLDAARDAVERYREENPPSEEQDIFARGPVIRKNLSGVFVAVLLLSIHLAVMSSSAPEDYVDVFGAQARRIQSGEIYRCVTALLLHADDAHLAGNMVAAALFGGAVCAVTGSGVGWLMILFCGVAGNFINAMIVPPGHLSIGASTAVFGAVGILCTLQAVRSVLFGRGWKKAVAAIGAGMALLAFLGSSARSDLGAHLFGFVCGLPMGGLCQLWIEDRVGKKGQILCGVLAATILIVAWLKGVWSS